MHQFIRTALVLCITLLFATQAPAAGTGSYTVAPFTVNGPATFGYLEKAIPSMLSSRLYWKGHFEPVADTASAKIGKISGSASAAKALAASGAGYVVWGDINIIGNDAAISARVTDKAGKEWRREAKSRVNDLIPSLQNLADGINSELFGRPLATSTASAASQSATSARPLNPDMIQNQTTGGPVYLNPQIRYQGAEGSRLRTQNLPYAAYGMEVGDFDGDGKNEIAILGKNKLYIYRWTDKLDPVAEYALPRTQLALAIRSIDLNRDRVPELVISMVGIDTNVQANVSNNTAQLCTDPDDPFSYILSFKGGKFKEIAKRLKFYLSVAILPPDYRAVLVGQKSDAHRVFDRSGVHEVNLVGDKFVFGKRLDIPEKLNLFGFTWLPGDGQKEPQMLVGLNKDERLVVYSEKGSDLYTSSDPFSGSPAAVEAPSSMPGLGKDYSVSPTMTYIPMRMIATDLDKNKRWELLVNKPISVAAQYFASFRDYPEGEIQALSWDGVGLSLLWKTRRIKGAVVDFGLTDANNDKTLDLVVCVNSYSGALGISKTRTMLVAYPLDLERADPNTPPVQTR